MEPIRVLIADDHPFFREGVRVLLDQRAKQLPRLTETTTRKIFVRALERTDRSHVVFGRLGSGRGSGRSLWARRWRSVFRRASFDGGRMAQCRFRGRSFSSFGRGSTSSCTFSRRCFLRGLELRGLFAFRRLRYRFAG